MNKNKRARVVLGTKRKKRLKFLQPLRVQKKFFASKKRYEKWVCFAIKKSQNSHFS
jgi:hypothetical protein